LQAPANQLAEVAGRRTEVAAAIAVLMLALGFTLGGYREPILKSTIRLAQSMGLAREPPDADTAYAAYQDRKYSIALRLARPLAEQGVARAQFILGSLYYSGQSVPQDSSEALKWFRRAADQGDARAQYNLGLSYTNGEAGEQDNVSAHMWFNLAAAHFPTSDTDSRSAAITRRTWWRRR
jgi:hypothetical protein